MRILAIVMMMGISLTAHSGKVFNAGPSGGYGGNVFSDYPPSDFLQLHSIKVCSGSRIDSFEAKVLTTSGRVQSYGKHGGNGGSCSTFTFWSGEYIISLSGRYGSVVDSFQIHTNFNRTFKKGGTGGRKVYRYIGDAQFEIAGFNGSSGSLIDAIGVRYFRTY